jgi:hypothetical protein
MDELFGDDEAVVADQGAARGANSFLAVVGQRNVGGAGVFAGERPFGLAVADDEAARSCDSHCGIVVGGRSETQNCGRDGNEDSRGSQVQGIFVEGAMRIKNSRSQSLKYSGPG